MRKLCFALLLIGCLLWGMVGVADVADVTDAMLGAFVGTELEGYTPLLYSRSSGHNAVAIVMHQKDHRVLCILEPEGDGWRIAVQSDEAISDESVPMEDWLVRLDAMEAGSYSISFGAYKRAQGNYTLNIRPDESGDWVISGFAFRPSYSGIVDILGFDQFGMLEDAEAGEGALSTYAGRPAEGEEEPEIERGTAEKQDLPLSFRLEEFDLRAYTEALLGLYCGEAAVQEALDFKVTNADMAADCTARYEADGSIHDLYDAWIWQYGSYYTWDTNTWARFGETFAPAAREAALEDRAFVNADLYKLSANAHRLPGSGELTRAKAIEQAEAIAASHGWEPQVPMEDMIVRASVFDEPHDGRWPVWKVAFFTPDYQAGALVQLDAQSGAENDYTLWDAAVLGKIVPFTYTRPGEIAQNLEDWYAIGSSYYYNPNGGQYYHTNPECSSVSERYRPLTRFLKTELGEEPYNVLQKCPKCGQ